MVRNGVCCVIGNKFRYRLATDFVCFLLGVCLSIFLAFLYKSCSNERHESMDEIASQIFREYSSYDEVRTDYNVEKGVYIKIVNEYPSSKEVSLIKNRLENGTYYIDKNLYYKKK